MSLLVSSGSSKVPVVTLAQLTTTFLARNNYPGFCFCSDSGVMDYLKSSTNQWLKFDGTVISTDPVSTAPLRVATAWNSIPSGQSDAVTGLSYIGYSVHKVAGGAKATIGLMIPLWALLDSSLGEVYVAPNNISFTGFSVEYNGVVAPLPVGSVRTATGTAGTTLVVPDASVQSLFGIPSIPTGAEIRIKVGIQFTAGQKFLKTINRGGYDSVSNYYTYDPAATVMSSIDTAGPPTWTGTAPIRFDAGLDPIVVGRNVMGLEDRTLVHRGDSISAGYVDNILIPTVTGPGYIPRSASSFSVPLAVLSLSVGGIRSARTNTATVLNDLYKLARFGICSTGTNDFSDGSGSTAAQVLARNQAVRDTMKAAGIEKVVISGMMCRTSSASGGWTSAGDQTVSWDSQAQVTAYNSSLPSAGFDGYCTFPSIRDATDPTLWKTDGGWRSWVQDGIHPFNYGHRDAAVDFKPVLAAALGIS